MHYAGALLRMAELWFNRLKRIVGLKKVWTC